MKKISLYNTRGRKQQTFKPLDINEVGLYTCGPTVYDFAHIGNLRTYIFEDLLKKTLRFAGYPVKHVMNITDVGHLTSDENTGEDKMEKGAKREHKTVWEIADYYTKAFKQDLHLLNIQEPDVWTRATDYIPQQIAIIQTLEQKGYTYKTQDGIYFDTAKDKHYGAWADLDFTGNKPGARVDVEGKKNPRDFALWKFSPKNKKRQMEWESPWGVGFPGWHIECSAMSSATLQNLDIHCGGIDHIPVHHTNEVAQSECSGTKPFFRYWMHGEFLVLTGHEKMSKSKGNFLTLPSLIQAGYDPLSYRFLCLSTHYRKSMLFSDEILNAAENGYFSLIHLLDRVSSLKIKKKIPAKSLKLIESALFDDLDYPKALGGLFSILNETKYNIVDDILELDKQLFGLDLEKKLDLVRAIPQEIHNLIKKREHAREQKDFALSDQIRDEIMEAGYTVSDTKYGPVVRKRIK